MEEIKEKTYDVKLTGNQILTLCKIIDRIIDHDQRQGGYPEKEYWDLQKLFHSL